MTKSHLILARRGPSALFLDLARSSPRRSLVFPKSPGGLEQVGISESTFRYSYLLRRFANIGSGKVSSYRFHPLDGFRGQKKIIITLTHGEFDQIDCKMESVAYYYKK